MTTCRPAVPADLEDVRRLTCGFDGADVTPADDAFRARYERLVASDDHALLVAVDGTEVVGYALAQDYGPPLRRAFAIGRMYDLYVDPARRRRGAGRALMAAVAEWAAARPAPLVLDWQSRREAVPFYEALGFTGDPVGDNAEYPAYCIDGRVR